MPHLLPSSIQLRTGTVFFSSRPILFKPVEMRLVDTWGRLEGLLEEQHFSVDELHENLGLNREYSFSVLGWLQIGSSWQVSLTLILMFDLWISMLLSLNCFDSLKKFNRQFWHSEKFYEILNIYVLFCICNSFADITTILAFSPSLSPRENPPTRMGFIRPEALREWDTQRIRCVFSPED